MTVKTPGLAHAGPPSGGSPGGLDARSAPVLQASGVEKASPACTSRRSAARAPRTWKCARMSWQGGA